MGENERDKYRSFTRHCIPDVTCRFDWIVERADDILIMEGQLAILVYPPFQVVAEGATCHRDVVPVN